MSRNNRQAEQTLALTNIFVLLGITAQPLIFSNNLQPETHPSQKETARQTKQAFEKQQNLHKPQKQPRLKYQRQARGGHR